jgi:excisionase family DNA binding protein
VSTIERYVDARELAELMGVSVRTVMRWVAAGAPSETWGMRRTRRFLASEVIAWARRQRTIDDDNSLARRSNVAETINRRR